MNLFLLDNYDSFTYNLVEAFRELGVSSITVRRNDQFELDSLASFDAIVLSPGPGLPKDAGLMPEVLRTYAHRKPILGICLGLQAIVEHFGGSLYNLPAVYHGIASPLTIHEPYDPIFRGIESPFLAGRYHSWAAVPDSLPETLLVSSTDASGEIMSVRHAHLPVYGLQFHPESILTPAGPQMLSNFIHLCNPPQPI
jgi:anthranilate synthase component 2